MREDDCNLIDQPWIRVRMTNASLRELSMADVFAHAQDIQALAGELPTQDAAILRLLLAVLHTVFSRVNADGEDDPLEEAESEDDGLDRWQSLWERKCFPVQPIQNYLKSVRERFWLFDVKRPFYQAPEARNIAGKNQKKELKCKATKLDASINQSENKERIFLNKNGIEKNSLSFSEAARWLVHMVAYDDCGVKKSDSFKKWAKENKIKEDGSPGVGWLGKLGMVYAEGDNLFETLLLNMVMLPNGEYHPYNRENPVWEWADARVREREKISCPDNMAELLTFPSRYILLEKEKGKVIGGYPVFGMYFESGEAALEQMSRRNGTKNSKLSPYEPLRHEQGKFLWQEFDSLFVCGEEGDDSRPGIVRWINRLQAQEDPLIEPDRIIRFRSVGIYYDSNRSSIEQIETDSLSVHSGVISALGSSWRKVISEELAFTERVTNAVGYLNQNIYTAKSNKLEDRRDKSDPVRAAREHGKAVFYESLDIPFREWILSIRTDISDPEIKRAEWRDLVRKTADRIGKEIIESAGPAAYVGHLVKKTKEDSGVFYSSPKAYLEFKRYLNKIR